MRDAEFVYDNSIDVALDMRSTKNAAAAIFAQMEQKNYSTANWADSELHPKSRDESTVSFIFTMDLLNFSFWSEKPDAERFAVSYRDQRWTGYWSLVASLQRALDEGGLPLLLLLHAFLSVSTLCAQSSFAFVNAVRCACFAEQLWLSVLPLYVVVLGLH